MKDNVVGIIYSDLRKKEVLITKRRDVPVWVFPSGGIDPNETPEQAILREVTEETGLTCAIVRKTGEYSPINRLTSTVHVYECEVLGGVMSLCDETADIGFYPIDGLPESFFFLHQEWMTDAHAGHQNVIRRPIANVTYWELFKYTLQHPIMISRALLARLGFPLNAKQTT